MRYSCFVDIDCSELGQRLGISERCIKRTVFRYERYLNCTPIRGRNILEIGAGTGMLSCLFSLGGAASVTAIEPQLEGSECNAKTVFRQRLTDLHLKNVVLVDKRLQECEFANESFDLIMAVASVNHWDEELVVRLHNDDVAARAYIAQFERIMSWLDRDGVFILTDVARHNVFSWLSNNCGLRNPLSPTLEWFKHQQPKTWVRLLNMAGFSPVSYKWLSPASSHVGISRIFDNAIFNNAIAAYLTLSKFVLWAKKK